MRLCFRLLAVVVVCVLGAGAFAQARIPGPNSQAPNLEPNSPFDKLVPTVTYELVLPGEHSAHYYFRDFWRADTGMLAAMHVLAALGEQQRPLSELVAEYYRYADSGEINSTVADQADRTRAVRAAFTDEPGVSFDELDGLTVSGPDWWFNLRASNTEPLLRLNVEARDAATMAKLRDQVLSIVRG